MSQALIKIEYGMANNEGLVLRGIPAEPISTRLISKLQIKTLQFYWSRSNFHKRGKRKMRIYIKSGDEEI